MAEAAQGPFVVDDEAQEAAGGQVAPFERASGDTRVRKTTRLLELIVRTAVFLNEKDSDGGPGEWVRHYLARSDTKNNTGSQFALSQLASAVQADRPALQACGVDVAPNVKVCLFACLVCLFGLIALVVLFCRPSSGG